jgi:RNA polymerase sigma factor (sigma-70 family)
LKRPPPSACDDDLWKDFKAGNKASFEKLMSAHYRSLFSYGLKFTKNTELVRDCLQDLFLELWKNRESLGATSYVRSYLFKSFRNKIWRVLHQNRWHHRAEQIQENYYLIREETLRYTTAKFSSLLNQLPKRQKEIVYLRFYQNLDIQEIVQVMEITSQSAYNLLHKAISSLRENPGTSVDVDQKLAN